MDDVSAKLLLHSLRPRASLCLSGATLAVGPQKNCTKVQVCVYNHTILLRIFDGCALYLWAKATIRMQAASRCNLVNGILSVSHLLQNIL